MRTQKKQNVASQGLIDQNRLSLILARLVDLMDNSRFMGSNPNHHKTPYSQSRQLVGFKIQGDLADICASNQIIQLIFDITFLITTYT